MAEILNNDEIEALLQAFQESGLDEIAHLDPEPSAEREIRHFDFNRPRRFRRHQLVVLQGIHEEASRRLRASIVESLKVQAETEFASSEQIRFESLLAQLPDRPIVYSIRIPSFTAPTLLAIDHSLVFAGIDRMLGGPGSLSVPPREPTKLEDLVAQSLVEKLTVAFTTAWATTAVKLSLETGSRLAGPALLGVMDPKEVGFAASYDVTGTLPKGRIRIFIPYRGLQPYLDTIAPDNLGVIEPGVRTEAMMKAIMPVKVQLGARLGCAQLSLDDLLKLSVGDTILLDRNVGDPIDVRVGEESKYWGWLGSSAKKYAVRILGPIHSTSPQDFTEENSDE